MNKLKLRISARLACSYILDLFLYSLFILGPILLLATMFSSGSEKLSLEHIIPISIGFFVISAYVNYKAINCIFKTKFKYANVIWKTDKISFLKSLMFFVMFTALAILINILVLEIVFAIHTFTYIPMYGAAIGGVVLDIFAAFISMLVFFKQIVKEFSPK